MSGVNIIKNAVRLSVSILIGFLLTSLCFVAFPQTKNSLVNAISTLPVDGVEYTTGSTTAENSPLPIWYSWIDTSGTQVIYYALYTTPSYKYPVPIANILGQHLRLADGTQLFVASALSGLEVYNDLNGDGIPQADFLSGTSELLYYMYVNMSDSYSMVPVQKIMQDSIPHYRWSFTYENVHGFLQSMASRIGVAASFIFSHITLSYDFSVNGNVSSLKTDFDIGKVTDMTILDSSQFTLDGLSLALLYATATYTSKPYSTYVDGREYNSATGTYSVVEADLARVQVDEVKAYDFVFGGNYTLDRSNGNQTHEANIETYEAKAEAVTLSGVPTAIRVNPVSGMSFFRNKLNLADLFGGSWRDFNLNYEGSSLIYRICFPAWDGMQIRHDPVYVGYFLSTTDNSQSFGFPAIITLSAVAVVTAVILTLFMAIRKRRIVTKQKQS